MKQLPTEFTHRLDAMIISTEMPSGFLIAFNGPVGLKHMKANVVHELFIHFTNYAGDIEDILSQTRGMLYLNEGKDIAPVFVTMQFFDECNLYGHSSYDILHAFRDRVQEAYMNSDIGFRQAMKDTLNQYVNAMTDERTTRIQGGSRERAWAQNRVHLIIESEF